MAPACKRRRSWKEDDMEQNVWTYKAAEEAAGAEASEGRLREEN